VRGATAARIAHHAYLILGQGKKKKVTVSVIESSKAAPVVSYLSSRAEWNLKILGKHKIIRLNQIGIHKGRTKLVPSPAGMTNGTV
jgi:hypothetical protein